VHARELHPAGNLETAAASRRAPRVQIPNPETAFSAAPLLWQDCRIGAEQVRAMQLITCACAPRRLAACRAPAADALQNRA
jgi:hypothetical protein